ncbi:cytochrome c oxidase subunit 6B1-like [Tetranychus urticae]|uniref:Cytochrome c oxidase subunit n=1 Tax=Tetranychus urticae TaxID=32264 RepID=T1KKK8_TETUR|nr:cytochrome c oxidase subunit 6B1-like [Tetranychus urticae]
MPTYEEKKEYIKKLLGPAKPDGRMARAAPPDPRFPNTNQALNCYQNYIDYHRCLKKKPGWEACEWYRDNYETLCPSQWHKKWDWQRKRGIFAGDI